MQHVLPSHPLIAEGRWYLIIDISPLLFYWFLFEILAITASKTGQCSYSADRIFPTAQISAHQLEQCNDELALC